MVKNVPIFSKDDVLKCLVLYTTQKQSVSCHRGGKKATMNRLVVVTDSIYI